MMLRTLAPLVALPCLLHGQVDTTARLMGTAKSAFNGRPLSGVMIAVPSVRKFVVTDASGTFMLSGLPVGHQRVSVAYNGRGTDEYDFELRRGKTKRISIVLDVEAVDLDPIVVEVHHRDGWKNLAGFFERRRYYGGFGNFYTREDIERQGFRSVAAILRRMGIATRCIDEGCVPAKLYRGSICRVTVAVDGMAFYANEYESVLIDDVQGVEIYGGMFGTPPTMPVANPSYPRSFLSSGREYAPELGTPICMTVAIWTR